MGAEWEGRVSHVQAWEWLKRRTKTPLGLCHCLPSGTRGPIDCPWGHVHFANGCWPHGGIGTIM